MKNNEYPLYEVQPFSSIKEMIELAVRDAGDKIAYKYKDGEEIKEVTFSKFVDTVTALGAFLNKEELSDKHIACIGANSYNWIVAYMTALRSKGVFVPIDKEMPGNDIINILKDSETSVVFYDAKYEELFKSHADGHQIFHRL